LRSQLVTNRGENNCALQIAWSVESRFRECPSRLLLPPVFVDASGA
jgi:hypothetical protein